MTYHDGIILPQLQIVELPELNCTRTDDCPAEPDRHQPDCPVERKLREELGF